MNTTIRWTILALIITAVAVAAAKALKQRDAYPGENDAFEGGTPAPGDGMSQHTPHVS